MLGELSVQSMALMEDVRVELQPGFCAWTGETGAGKTLLLSALGLLLGERGAADLIRAGAEELRVVGRFELVKPGLRQAAEEILQGPLDDEQLILMRRLHAGGRSAAYCSARRGTLARLRQRGAALVDLHGQRESQSLLQPAFQLRALDAYGDLEPSRDRYRAQAAKVRELRRRLAGLEADRQKRQRELALVRFERDELDQAALRGGELARLAREREMLAHAQAIQDYATSAVNRLYDEDGSLFEMLGKLQREAEHWARLDPTLADVSSRLTGIASEARDLAATLRPFAERGQADPARRDEIETRLQLLRRLETQYGRSVDELIGCRQSVDAQAWALAGQGEDRTPMGTERRRGWL